LPAIAAAQSIRSGVREVCRVKPTNLETRTVAALYSCNEPLHRNRRIAAISQTGTGRPKYRSSPESTNSRFDLKMQPGLIGAVLYAKDLQRLTEFYSAVAGLQVQIIREGFAVLGQRPSQLVIVRIPRRISESISIETPPILREDTPIKLVFIVANITAARKSAAERGGNVRPGASEWQFEGAKVCDGHDPEGNVFQLRYPG
jgi:predicted enzyme related to lactoylglutathione lyase